MEQDRKRLMYKVAKQFLAIKKSVFIIYTENSGCLFTTLKFVYQNYVSHFK